MCGFGACILEVHGLSWWFSANLDPVSRWWHGMHSGCVADILVPSPTDRIGIVLYVASHPPHPFFLAMSAVAKIKELVDLRQLFEVLAIVVCSVFQLQMHFCRMEPRRKRMMTYCKLMKRRKSSLAWFQNSETELILTNAVVTARRFMLKCVWGDTEQLLLRLSRISWRLVFVFILALRSCSFFMARSHTCSCDNLGPV